MNRHVVLLVSALVLGSAFSLQAGTDDPPQGHHALRKLGRGVGNTLFGIVEVPNQMTKAHAEHGGGAFFYGIGKGFVRWIGRELVGVYEIVTFPAPLPAGYRPIMQPEFPGEDYEP